MAIKNLVVKPNGDIILKNVRTSYLYCHEPQTNTDDKGNTTKKYKCTAILEPEGEHKDALAELKRILDQRQKDKWKARIPRGQLCLRDGDPTEKDEYAGKWILVMSEKEENPPACLDRDGKTKVKKSDDKLYSGCYANVMFRFWDQDNSYGKRINANFLGIQFLRHGDKFSSVERPKDDEMFDDEGGGEEGDAWGDDDDGL